jgi:uncharacterized membrane protein
MVGEIWRKTRPKILKFIFLPYMIYFTLFILYISFIFTPIGERTVTDWVIQVPCLLFSAVQLVLEAKQLIREGPL